MLGVCQMLDIALNSKTDKCWLVKANGVHAQRQENGERGLIRSIFRTKHIGQ